MKIPFCKPYINNDEINEVVKTLHYDEFVIKKEHILVKINNMPVSVLELFNDIKLNDDIPFAYCKEFYKILKGFKPENKNLIVSDNLNLELKVNETTSNVSFNKFEDYLDQANSNQTDKKYWLYDFFN